MATKKAMEDIDLPTPLRPVESWVDAAELARSALAFTVSDPRESGAVRVKAAELILGYSRQKQGGVPSPNDGLESIEDWLAKQPSESCL